MVEARIRAETAAFLDSECSRDLEVDRVAQQKIAQRFLTCCYDDLAKEPRLLEGDDIALALRERLPRYFGKGDPLAHHCEDVLNAFVRYLRDTMIVPHAYEIGIALDAHISEFRDLVASGTAHSGGIAKTRVLGVERRGTKVGRNDPCPCGSGKKFKKCCGTIG